MKTQHQIKVDEIKQASILFHEEISNKIDNLSNDPKFGYKKASLLSNIGARLDQFIEELKSI